MFGSSLSPVAHIAFDKVSEKGQSRETGNKTKKNKTKNTTHVLDTTIHKQTQIT
jgi:hypothetical protein